MPLQLKGHPCIDTDVIIRLLTGDDPAKQARARELFKRVEAGEMTLIAPVSVIADCIYVLSSPRLYHLPKTEIVGLLQPLLRLPRFKIPNRRTLLRALDLYLATKLSFGDVYILATMERLESRTLYSFDQGFDGIQGIQRLEP
ncbi:MAG: PIN domain-containing protein [Chloroflexi bacterium]|nr:PIN domain-containing protein [Chloroflexota bacterium]